MKYYVYGLLDPRKNNQPFYIGKGCGDRAKAHLSETVDKTENVHKVRKIIRIREAGLEPLIEYFATNLEQDAAYNLEATLICRYGRANIDPNGILTNICIDQRPPDPTGKPVSEETRKKIGDAQRGELNHRYGDHWDDDEKQRRREFNIGHGIKPPVRSGPMSAEQKAAIANGNRGKKRTAEQSAYLSAIRKGKKRGPYNEQHRQSISQSLGGSIGEDLTGRRYGEWTVLTKGDDKRVPGTVKKGAQHIFWQCRCVCGHDRQVCQARLIRAESSGCGCVKRASNA